MTISQGEVPVSNRRLLAQSAKELTADFLGCQESDHFF
jgi:hypothetical protein